MKHTPGPWKVSPHYETGVLGANGEYICDSAYGGNIPMAKANAKLIAAAPELLEALKLLLPALKVAKEEMQFRESKESGFAFKAINTAIGATEAAIKKATE